MPSASGVIVEFRDNATKDLLWKAGMHCVPQEDAVIEWTDPDDVIRTYEVNGIKYAFNSPNPGAAFSGTISCTDARHTPILFVTEL